MYVFYGEDAPGALGLHEEGRYEGIKVIRAPLTNCLDPHAYQVFYRDPSGVESWTPSLPSGFTKETILNFVGIRGPKATDITGDEVTNFSHENRFSVAQVRNTSYFMGVETYIRNSDSTYHVGLRYSSDLIHWTEIKREIYSAQSYSTNTMSYSIFLSADGWSNNVIDSNEFHVIGTNPGSGSVNNRVYRIAVVAPPAHPPPPPPPPPGDPGGSPCPNDPNSMCITGTNLPIASGSAAQLSDAVAVGIYPNPSRGYFLLSYALAGTGRTQIDVLDVTGRVLQKGVSSVKAAGRYQEYIDISQFAKGTYMVELLVNGTRRTYKTVKM